MSEFVPTALCRKCDMMFTFNGYPGCVAESINDSERYIMQCCHGTEGYFSKDPKDDGKFIQEKLQIGPAKSKEEMKACPFCGKEDGLEIVWYDYAGTLEPPYSTTYTEVERGDPKAELIEIQCYCGEYYCQSIDGLTMAVRDRYGLDAEATPELLEEELIRQWNSARR